MFLREFCPKHNMKSKCMEVLKKISEVFYLEHDAEWSLVLSSLVVGKVKHKFAAEELLLSRGCAAFLGNPETKNLLARTLPDTKFHILSSSYQIPNTRYKGPDTKFIRDASN